jgi:hypothetical protein
MSNLRNAGYVIGKTNERVLFIASDTHSYAVNEYLKIIDTALGQILCGVVESFMYPFIDESMLKNNEAIAFSLRQYKWFRVPMTVYVAKVRVLDNIDTPITVGSPVETPLFEEVQALLMPVAPEAGLTFGVIKGTERMHLSLSKEHQNVAPIFDSKENQLLLQKGVPFVFNYRALREYPHIGMFGGSGSGKTYALRVFLEEVMTKQIPGIVLDPHYEMDFSEEMNGLPPNFKQDFSRKFELFEVGKNVGIYFPDLRCEELSAILQYAGPMTEPMSNAVKAIHKTNDSETRFRIRLEKLLEAYENFELPPNRQRQLSPEILQLYEQYKSKIPGRSTLQAISWRFQSLVNENIFTHDVTKVESCLLKRKIAVIRGNQHILNILAGYVVNKLYHKRRACKDWEQFAENDVKSIPSKFPPFFLIADEAHNFAPKTEPSATSTLTKRVFREISQEGRKYGVFLVLATQRPSLLDMTLSAQLNTKIIFRTGIKSDMQMIKTETNLTELETSRLPELNSGDAFISSATLPRTVPIRFRITKTKSPHTNHPFDELDNYNENEKIKAALKEFLPLSTDSLPKKHREINEKIRERLSAKAILDFLDEMASDQDIAKEVTPMGYLYYISQL